MWPGPLTGVESLKNSEKIFNPYEKLLVEEENRISVD